jgi:NADH-quinone oxidoreductase subunit L
MAMLLYYTGALDFAGITAGADGLLTKVQIWPIGGGLPSWFPFKPAAPVEVYASTLCGLALFLGCAGKSAQIPLYVWLPDAMAGPTPVSALIHAATMVTAGIYLVCRLHPVFLLSPFTMATIALTGALTAFFAATIGLVQHDLKKVLAYSTVSQLGYMFLGVGVGAFEDGFFHVFTHAFFKACLFLGAGSVIHAMHANIHDTDASQDMRNMGGLRKYMPFTHATYLASCLAIAGFPFTSGFFSKDEILAKAWENHIVAPQVRGEPLSVPPEWFGKMLFVLGIVGALMTSFYMFRTYFLTFWGDFKGWRIDPLHKAHGHHGHHDHAHFEPGEGREHLVGKEPHESPWQMTVPLMVLATFALFGGFLNASLLGHTVHSEKLTMLGHWLAPVFHHAEAAVKSPPFEVGHAWMMAVPGITVALLGIGLAYWIYELQGGEPAKKLAEAVGPLYPLVLDKWRVDEAYDATVIGAVDELAQTAVVFDKWVVDGILARLSSGLVQLFGFLLRLTQTGRVQVYGMAMAIGTVGMIGWFYLPHASVVVADSETGAKLTAAPGIGYKYRWDADGDGKPDSKDFGDVTVQDIKVDPGKTVNVTLEVENAFKRTTKRVIPVTRAKNEDMVKIDLGKLIKQAPSPGAGDE